jgi:hypothetical protein
VMIRPLNIQLAGVLLKRSRRELCSCCGVSEPPRCGGIIVDEAIVCQSSSSCYYVDATERGACEKLRHDVDVFR